MKSVKRLPENATPIAADIARVKKT